MAKTDLPYFLTNIIQVFFKILQIPFVNFAVAVTVAPLNRPGNFQLPIKIQPQAFQIRTVNFIIVVNIPRIEKMNTTEICLILECFNTESVA